VNVNALKRADHVCILVRDPVTRFISIFYYYHALYKKYINKQKIPHVDTVKKTVNLFNRFDTVEKVCMALNSLNEAEKRLARSVFSVLLYLVFNFGFYLTPQIIQLIQQKKKVFMIRQECYEEDFRVYYDFLRSKYKLEDKFILFMKNKRNNTDQYSQVKSLSETALRNLKQHLKGDYSVLNQCIQAKLINKEYTFKYYR